MPKESITIHDNFQFEIKLSLPFAADGKKSEHSVETYLFAPNSLCINPSTLSREDFFGRLKNYIRLRIPWVALEDLDKPGGPLARLEGLLAKTTDSTPPAKEEFEDQVKIFCLAAKRALRSLTFKTVASPEHRAADEAERYLVQSQRILRRYRALAESVQAAGFHSSPAYAYGDEFLSIAATYYAFRILDRMEASGTQKLHAKIDAALSEFIKNELQYRKETLGAVIPAANSDNELFVFRWSMLKKYMSSALYLEIRERRDKRFWEQVAYSLAAGAAMIFATGIAFIWQGRYGTLSMPLFTALIVSYIFKDRMKDLLRASMSSWLRRVLSDRKLSIFRNFTTPIGICKESFNFESEKRLPAEVTALRDKVHMVDVSNSFRRETVIRYRKDIIISPKVAQLSSCGCSDGMMDITRMGVHDFLRYMDEPEEPLYTLEKDGFRRVTGSKVYHVNMIRTQQGPDGNKCRRYRIVLDRNGIKRIERVR